MAFIILAMPLFFVYFRLKTRRSFREISSVFPTRTLVRIIERFHCMKMRWRG